MVINNLKIVNFKSIRSLSLQPRQINIFFGKPNSGKSNILEALGLISSLSYNEYAANGKKKFYFSTQFIRYEHLMNLFYENNTNDDIVIQIDSKRVIITNMEDNYIVYFRNKEKNANKTKLLTISEEGGFSQHFLSPKPKLFNSIKFYRFIKRKRFPAKKTAFLLPPDGGNLATVLQSNVELREIIYHLLEPFELELNIRIEEDKVEFLKRIKYGRITFPLSLVAETIQRLIFILGIIFTNKDSVIVLEEPETHIFPFYSKYIAETIVRRLKINKNQYFFSTHNPYFLTTILEKSDPEDIALFAVRYKNRTTEVYQLSNNDIEELLYYEEDPFFNIDRFFK